MFHNLRRYFYNNKLKIMRNVLIIILAILLIQGLNYYARQQATIDNKVTISNEFVYGNLIDFGSTTNKNNVASGSNEVHNGNQINPNNNIISGNSIENGGGANNQVGSNAQNNINSSNITNGNTGNSSNSSNEDSKSEKEKTIISFLDLCIQGNVEQAYEMISEECKKVLFSTVERFQKNYYSRVFNSNKVYTIEGYYGNTYKVKIAENMNSTGAYTSLANTDYITANYTDDGIKLNINNYIGRFNVNSSATRNDITINVNYKDVFMEYERYNITVNNGYAKSIMLNGYNSNNTMYTSGRNGNKYYAYINEISENSLILRSGSIADFNIKYNCPYGENTGNVSKLVFFNIILDYDSYNKLENNSEYKERDAITVDI